MRKYYNQNGCHNCKWVFKKEDFNDIDEYFCNNHNTGQRPLCMSVSMRETPEDILKRIINNEEWYNFLDKWEVWANKRKVNAWGMCLL